MSKGFLARKKHQEFFMSIICKKKKKLGKRKNENGRRAGYA